MKQVSVCIRESKIKSLKELAKKNNISFNSLIDQMINIAYDKN